MRQSAKYVAIAYSRFSDMPIKWHYAWDWPNKSLDANEKSHLSYNIFIMTI